MANYDGTFQVYGTNHYCVARNAKTSLIALDSTCDLDEEETENADLGNRGHDMASICEADLITYCIVYQALISFLFAQI